MPLITVPSSIATWKPFSGKSEVFLQQDIICLHTMVGTLNGSWSWANQSGNPYWHFGVGGDGTCLYCHDLAHRSAANLNGNWRVIPIETADTNESVFSTPWANPLWTPKQMDKIVALCAWLCKQFNIPPVLIPDTKPGRRGIAYHRQGINPWRVDGGELWSKANGKICPADRVSQVNTVVSRVKTLVQGVDMTPTEHKLLVDAEARSEAILKFIRDGALANIIDERVDARVKAILDREWTNTGTPVRKQTRILAKLGAEDALKPAVEKLITTLSPPA